jgi:hypothetical protein
VTGTEAIVVDNLAPLHLLLLLHLQVVEMEFAMDFLKVVEIVKEIVGLVNQTLRPVEMEVVILEKVAIIVLVIVGKNVARNLPFVEMEFVN